MMLVAASIQEDVLVFRVTLFSPFSLSIKPCKSLCRLSAGDHVRQDSMDFSKEWEQDPSNCRCADRLKPLERRKARQHQRCLAHSLVGTPNYIAPEVLLRTGKPVKRKI